VDLNVCDNSINDDINWTILCQSLKAHPSLTSLNLNSTSPSNPTGGEIILAEEQKTNRTRLLAEMVQRNTVLRTITLSEGERDQQMYAEILLTCARCFLWKF
jgi:hypothetical protein